MRSNSVEKKKQKTESKGGAARDYHATKRERNHRTCPTVTTRRRLMTAKHDTHTPTLQQYTIQVHRAARSLQRCRGHRLPVRHVRRYGRNWALSASTNISARPTKLKCYSMILGQFHRKYLHLTCIKDELSILRQSSL